MDTGFFNGFKIRFQKQQDRILTDFASAYVPKKYFFAIYSNNLTLGETIEWE
jgi:hypothetical protein